MIIGIDLGTTNSAVAVWRDGRAELIPNSLGSVLTPSAVSLDDSGELLVGLAARERQVTHPQLTATAFKRYMGTTRKTKLGKKELLARGTVRAGAAQPQGRRGEGTRRSRSRMR